MRNSANAKPLPNWKRQSTNRVHEYYDLWKVRYHLPSTAVAIARWHNVYNRLQTRQEKRTWTERVTKVGQCVKIVFFIVKQNGVHAVTNPLCTQFTWVWFLLLVPIVTSQLGKLKLFLSSNINNYRPWDEMTNIFPCSKLVQWHSIPLMVFHVLWMNP